MRHITLIIAALTLAVAAPAIAGKGGVTGGNGNNGNNGNGGNGNGNRTSATLSANPSTLQSGDYFDVNGCGFDTALGNVVVGFTGGGWGSPLDSSGCFTIPDIPALSGDTLPPGTYPVTAYQYVNGRLTEVEETTVTVVL